MTSDAGVPGAPRFDVVLRGYDRRQVDEHVDRLQRVLARMRADLDVARSQPMPAVVPVPQAAAARPRPTPRPRPGAPVPHGESSDTIGNFTDRMQSILQAAEEEAAEIRRNAQKAARAETEGVRSQLSDLTRQRDTVLAELTRMRGQLEGLLSAPTAAMPARETSRPVQAGPGGDPARSGSPDAPRPDARRPGGHADGARPAPQPAPRPSPGRGAGAPAPSGRPAAGQQPGRDQNPAGQPPGAPSTSGRSGSAQPTSAQPTSASPASAQPGSAAPTAQPRSGSSTRAGAERAPQERRQAGAATSRPAPSNGTPTRATPAPGGPSGSSDSAARTDGPKAATADAPSRGSGKAAHRLPTGAYPVVDDDQPASLRPRSEPQPEPGELFRSAMDAQNERGAAEPRTTAVPQQTPGSTKDPGSTKPAGSAKPADTDGDGESADRTAMVPTVVPPRGDKPGDVESTVAVGSVRPGDPTVKAPGSRAPRPDSDGGSAAKPVDAKPGAGKPAAGNEQNGSARPTSPSRSG